MPDTHDLHLLDGHDLPRITRAYPSDGVLTQPPPNLGEGILLGGVEGVGDLGVEGGGD